MTVTCHHAAVSEAAYPQGLAHGGRLVAESRYMQAARALAVKEAEFFALDAADAGAAAKLECRGEREKASRVLADAERGLIGALWTDGSLTHETHIGEAVRDVLEALRRDGIGPALV